MRWQNRSDWLVTCRSWNWASTAANQATGASDQKAGSFMLTNLPGGGGGSYCGGSMFME